MAIPVNIAIPNVETTEVQLDVNPHKTIERENGTIWNVRSANFKAPPYTVEVTLKAEGSAVTATAGDNKLEKVKVGTPVAGSTLPKGATIASVIDPNTITIAATASIPEGTKANLTFTPTPVEVAIYAVEERFVPEKIYDRFAVFVEVYLYSYDGTVSADDATPHNATNGAMTGRYQLDVNSVMANNS